MSTLRDAGLFCLLALLWGGSFVAIEVGLDYYPPVLYAAYRFDVAALALLSYVLLTESDPIPRTWDDLAAIGLSGGLSVAANNSLLFVGQQYTTSGIASVTYSLVPIATAAVAAAWIGGADLDTRGVVGVVLAFLGVGLVAQPDPANLAGGVTIGVGLISIGVLAVAVGSVGLRTVETTFSSVALTGWAMLLGALLIHALSLGLDEGQRLPVAEPRALVALAFLGVLASAVAYAIYFTLLDRLGPFQINLVSYVVPIVATVAGAVLLAEPVTPLTIAGFAVVVAGFGLLKHRQIAATVPRLWP
ncbi:EamA family transporter [Halorubrum sp. CBA1125]|uniref:DMT family transporter n=1 Tax=Halorubrum sp. CBA1125 TaxID=2668072 RepID=UPI00135EE6FF|nr:DMT family transporter [Halorubrum sp. CBA1125]MUW13951.1 EamA family transporter [Halorubrum sp. CBA1125]